MSNDAYQYKQVLLIRRDLSMSRGKEIAQACHASMAVVLRNPDHPDVVAWLKGAFAKVALVVNSQEELEEFCKKATEAGIINETITDSGRTYFHGVPTVTVAALGPARAEEIDKITGHLKLR